MNDRDKTDAGRLLKMVLVVENVRGPTDAIRSQRRGTHSHNSSFRRMIMTSVSTTGPRVARRCQRPRPTGSMIGGLHEAGTIAADHDM